MARPLQPVGQLDLAARDAEQEEDGVEVGHAERGVRRLAHDRLGVEGDAEPGGGQHVDVVGPVAHRDGPRQGHAGRLGERASAAALPARSTIGPSQFARDDARLDGQHVGGEVIDAEIRHQRPDHLGEAAAHDGELVTEPLQRAHQRARRPASA